MRIEQVASGGGGSDDYILIRHETISSGLSGAFNSGAWQTKTINTLVVNIGSHASLAANQITLDAGTYKVKANGIGFLVNGHAVKLRNITDGVDVVIGSSSYANAANSDQSHSFLSGRFTIGSSKVFEFQHRCTTTRANNGFGNARGFGVIEVYSEIEFWKEP